ncbi:MAG: hypothetical protein AB2A00_37000, partial [Myxococcota bacterium]
MSLLQKLRAPSLPGAILVGLLCGLMGTVSMPRSVYAQEDELPDGDADLPEGDEDTPAPKPAPKAKPA